MAIVAPWDGFGKDVFDTIKSDACATARYAKNVNIATNRELTHTWFSKVVD